MASWFLNFGHITGEWQRLNAGAGSPLAPANLSVPASGHTSAPAVIPSEPSNTLNVPASVATPELTTDLKLNGELFQTFKSPPTSSIQEPSRSSIQESSEIRSQEPSIATQPSQKALVFIYAWCLSLLGKVRAVVSTESSFYLWLLEDTAIIRKCTLASGGNGSSGTADSKGSYDILRLLCYVLLKRTSWPCYLLIVVLAVSHASVLCMMPSVLLFTWGLLSRPFPSYRFWTTLTKYMKVLILMEYIFQFDFWGAEFEMAASCQSNVLKREDCFSFWAVLGLQRHSSDTPAYLLGLLPDVLLLLALHLHTAAQRRLGLWGWDYDQFLGVAKIQGEGVSGDGIVEGGEGVSGEGMVERVVDDSPLFGDVECDIKSDELRTGNNDEEQGYTSATGTFYL